METKSYTPPVLPVAVVVTLAALGAFVGVIWDIATHIDVGRDTFFAPAHIAIIASLTLGVNGALLIALIQGNKGAADDELRRFRRPLLRVPFLGIEITDGSLLSIVAVAIVSLSFPLDEFWHRVFGLDISLWSPPHVILILSGFTAAWGLTLQLVDELNHLNPARLLPGLRSLRTADRSTWVVLVGMGVYVAAMLILTAEFDFDVPQFNPIWHAPVLVGISAFIFALSRRAVDRRLAGTVVAGVATAARLLAVGVLVLLGRSTLHVPLLFVPMLFVDLLDDSGERRRSPVVTGAVYAAATVLVETLWMRISGGLVWSTGDVLVGGAISLFVGGLAWHIGDRAGRALRPVPRSDESRVRKVPVAGAIAGLTMICMLLVPAVAFAKGNSVVKVELSAPVRSDESFDVLVHLPAEARPTLIEFGRAQHRIARPPVAVGSSGDVAGRKFVIPSDGKWSLLVRYELRGVGYLADTELLVPSNHRSLMLEPQSDNRVARMPGWFPLAAWLLIAVVALVMLAILVRSFRSIKRGALSVGTA